MTEAMERLGLGLIDGLLLEFLLSFFSMTMLRTCNCSFQGRTVKNAGWDFSIGGSQGAGTVRALKPPQSRERRQEVTSDQSFQKASRVSGSQWSSTSGAAVPEISEGGFVKRDSYQNDFQEEVKSFASCVSSCLVNHFQCDLKLFSLGGLYNPGYQ